jgi:hypothetical protein
LAFADEVGTGLTSSAAHTPPQSAAAQATVISFLVFIFVFPHFLSVGFY